MQRRSWLVNSGVLLTYVLITVAMTWPLAATLRGPHYLTVGAYDDFENVWSFWWLHHALADLHTWPFHTDLLYHPFGSELALHALSPLISTLSVPITGLTSPETAFNLALLAAWVFSPFSMYLLLNYLVADWRAAFVGGCVLAYSSVRFFHLTLTNLISWQFFPLYVLLLIKMLREEQHQRRHAFFAGLALAFIFMIDYYQAIYAFFLTACYLLYYLLGRDEQGRRRLRVRRGLGAVAGRLLIVGAVLLVVGSPILVAIVANMRAGSYVVAGGSDIYYADIAGFFVPLSPLIRADWINQLNRPIIHNGGIESVVYVGWTTILLLIGGTIALGRRLGAFRFWLAFLFASFLLALGPQPHFLGNKLPFPGPYALWQHIPLLNNVRVSARFSMLVMFAAGVLVAYTLQAFFGWLARRRPAQARLLTAGVLILLLPLLLVEHLSIPINGMEAGWGKEVRRYPYLNQIAQEPGDFSVMNLPLYSGDVRSNIHRLMYDQTQHGHPMFAGSIARPLPHFASYYMSDEFIRLLSPDYKQLATAEANLALVLNNPDVLNFYRLDAAQLAYYLDVRYIVLRPRVLGKGSNRLISETLPVDLVYTSERADMVIYRVRQNELRPAIPLTDVLPLAAKSSAVFRLRGWWSPELDPETDTAYVSVVAKESEIITLIREPANYRVTIYLRPQLQDSHQTMTVYADDGTQLASVRLDKAGWQDVSFAVGSEHWRAGINKLHFEMDSLYTPTNGDSRTLGPAVSSITFTRQLACNLPPSGSFYR